MIVKNTNVYYLGDNYPGIYFTQREVDCLMKLLEGHTLVSTAEALGLSPRTVEFYVKNMRMKIGVHSKIALLETIREIDFVQLMNIPRNMSCTEEETI